MKKVVKLPPPICRGADIQWVKASRAFCLMACRKNTLRSYKHIQDMQPQCHRLRASVPYFDCS